MPLRRPAPRPVASLETKMKPVIVLVGHPNVGKSTLFNRLIDKHASLVFDEPGVTRDRLYGDGAVGDRPYFAVDTGGISEPITVAHAGGLGDAWPGLITAQIRAALDEADAVIFLVDYRAGVTAADAQIASELRRVDKPIWLAANKAEGVDRDIAGAEFHELGLGDPHAISASRGDGVGALMERVLAAFPVEHSEADEPHAPRLAVVGRPNVGKSTLVNALLGEERVVVFDAPGTTRDSIEIPLERDGRRYVLIDTAGVRRRRRVADAVEKRSIIKTLQAIDSADVGILTLDAQSGVHEQDAALAGYLIERGRALVLAVNKWDMLGQAARAATKRDLAHKLEFLDFAETHFISALRRTGINRLFAAVEVAYASSNRDLSTPKLTRVVESAARAWPAPVVRGRRIRLKYAHQGGKRPPVVVVHGNQLAALPAAYRRYLARAIRKEFHLIGTPIRIECRQAENPYRGRIGVSRPGRRFGAGRGK